MHLNYPLYLCQCMQSCNHLKFLVQNKFNQHRKLPAEKLGAKQSSSTSTRYQLNI